MKKRNEENYVKHTYKFYKDRKNDPKWRPSYLKARQQRIIWIVIGVAFILLISSISFFAYSYSNAGKHTPTESFNKSSNQSSSTSETSSSSKSSNSSSQEALKNMDNLDLNTKIAILSQAYAALNPNTTILQAANLAMSNSWDNGPIEWYDNQGARHKLDVQVTGDIITYSYVDPNTGQPTTQTASVNESLDRFYSLKSNMESTQAIANKCVAPANLKPGDSDGHYVGKTGGAADPSFSTPEANHTILILVKGGGMNYLKQNDYIFANPSAGMFTPKSLIQENSPLLPTQVYSFFWATPEQSETLGKIRVNNEVVFYDVNHGKNPFKISDSELLSDLLKSNNYTNKDF